MEMESVLSGKINLPDIKRLVSQITGNKEKREHLWRLIHSDDRQTSVNAIWVMTHLPATEKVWFEKKRDELTDMLLSTSDVSKRRMLLQTLRDMDYTPENIRTDLLDFCLSKINSECEAYAVRAFCIYLAFKMCEVYPDLLVELEEHLDMLSWQTMPPGLLCARRKTLSRISKIKNRRQPDAK